MGMKRLVHRLDLVLTGLM